MADTRRCGFGFVHDGLGSNCTGRLVLSHPALIQFGFQLPPMTRNAAACSLLCGVALLIVILRGPRWLTVVCAGIVSAISILTVVEYVGRPATRLLPSQRFVLVTGANQYQSIMDISRPRGASSCEGIQDKVCG